MFFNWDPILRPTYETKYIRQDRKLRMDIWKKRYSIMEELRKENLEDGLPTYICCYECDGSYEDKNIQCPIKTVYDEMYHCNCQQSIASLWIQASWRSYCVRKYIKILKEITAIDEHMNQTIPNDIVKYIYLYLLPVYIPRTYLAYPITYEIIF